MIRRYYSLRDLIEKFTPASADKTYIYTGEYIADTLKKLCGAIFPPIENTILNSLEANTLWCGYIANRYLDCYFNYEDDDNILEEIPDVMAAEFFRKFFYIFRDTYDEFKTLIDIYNANLAHLMDNVKSTTESKFNDTPQNVQGASYDWGYDDHLTSINKIENSTPVGTLMARIAEIQNNFKDVYSAWADRFKGLFIYD